MSSLREHPARILPGARANATVGLVGVLTTLLVADAASLGGSDGVVSRSVLEALLRVIAVVAACGTVGSLVLAALLDRSVDGPGGSDVRRSRGSTARWAGLWAVATCCALVLLVVGSPAGAAPPGVHAGEDPVTAAGDALRAGVVTVWAAGTVAVLSRGATRRGSVVGCLALAYAGLLPAVFTGHAGSADARVLALVSIAVHVIAVTTWVGGLLALVGHAAGGGDVVPVVRAFSSLALLSFVAVGVSGAVNLAARVPLAELPETGVYGVLLVGKLCGLAVLGALGTLHRRRSLRRLEAGGGAAFWALVAGELVVMAAVTGMAVVLARTAS
jgi:putative copper resistance protein D